ncbi:hypothetical protein AAFF_G00125150 [Aldrovandia affinis]|uniref:Uncharacterized protein n=1 Tax=Aldrovandia affinis TaxID=143900 RepID=A0AAD7RRB8_9TELE|nr:hypothetical protein AAFF_G00125150 [Aldrovandia affinis]
MLMILHWRCSSGVLHPSGGPNRTLSAVREDLGRSLFWETEDTTRPQTRLATEHSQNRTSEKSRAQRERAREREKERKRERKRERGGVGRNGLQQPGGRPGGTQGEGRPEPALTRVTQRCRPSPPAAPPLSARPWRTPSPAARPPSPRSSAARGSSCKPESSRFHRSAAKEIATSVADTTTPKRHHSTLQ